MIDYSISEVPSPEHEVIRVRLNEALIEIQNIQNTMMEYSLVGYCIILKGRFHVLNPIAASYTGYSMEELIGRKADFMVCSEDREELKRSARAMLKGSRMQPCEFRIITKQKEIRWIIQVLAPIKYRGEPAILATAMDITKRKTAEEKMMQSENLYRAIFETTGNVMMIIEEDMTISLINSEFEKLTGYRKEDWEGKKTWTELVCKKKDLSRMKKYFHLRRIDPRAVPKSYEYHLVDSQGRIRNVLTSVSIIPGTRKNVASITDITDLKEAEKELVIKTHNLRELNSALKVLLRQREDDREELETTLLSNIKNLVLPYIEQIKKTGLDKKSAVYFDLLESNLESILSPFSRKLSAKYARLTPKEVQIANLIKDGKSSKEIAGLLNVSSSSVDVYRYRIRIKLGLNNKKANLNTYLDGLL